MNQTLYPLSNAAHVPMLGREEVLKAVLNRIGKETGDHISIVGAPYIGKTTFLRHLADLVGPKCGGYLSVAFLDLRHHTPRTDHEFRQRFVKELHAALSKADDDSAELIELDASEEDLPQVINGVFDYLADSNRILVIMDGLDHVLNSPTISRNLWDYLREIGLKSSCTFVTGTRHRIRELCNNPDSLASEFWNIFADPVVVMGPFDDEEMEAVLVPLEKQLNELASSARKEIHNWTGGHPALVALICKTLIDDCSKGSTLDGETVNKRGDSMVDGAYALIQHLWDECPIELRGDLHALATDQLSADKIPPNRALFAIQRGFLTPSKKPKLNCRFIEKMALRHGSQTVELKKLFLTKELYAKQIQRVLELRLGHVEGGDAELFRRVKKTIRELSYGPADVISSVRMVTRRSLELIWDAELNNGKWPLEWAESWKLEGSYGLYPLKNTSKSFPSSDGAQCAVLCDITGGRYGNLSPVAKYVTRATYLLLEHVKSIGDLGQHFTGDITTAYAASICFTCIELFARLTDELPSGV